jgi:hypothetical protein
MPLLPPLDTCLMTLSHDSQCKIRPFTHLPFVVEPDERRIIVDCVLRSDLHHLDATIEILFAPYPSQLYVAGHLWQLANRRLSSTTLPTIYHELNHVEYITFILSLYSESLR